MRTNYKSLEAANKQIEVLSTLTNRMKLAGNLGMQGYGGQRDIYQALGYPLAVTYNEYFVRYIRQDIAKAIIDRPVNATWKGNLTILESDDDQETQLEKAWKELDKELKLKNKFKRVDKLTGIGHYGCLLLGFSDTSNISDYKTPVEGTSNKLHYLKPLGEGSCTIKDYDNDPKSERFGQPLIYQVTLSADTTNSTVTMSTSTTAVTLDVHYTRIIHILDEQLESEVIGIPRLQAVFNRLMDLEKIVGGDAEMFWRGARPGFQGKIDDGFTMTPQMQEDLVEQIDEYENNLRRMLINKGVTYEALTQQIADPKNHVDIQIQMISAVTEIPKRILTGSERGELASSQDKAEWNEYTKTRREEFATPNIVEPFIERCIEFGVLPEPKDTWSVDWPPVFNLSEKEKADIGKTKASALKEYTSNPIAGDILPRETFYKHILGMNEDEIALIEEIRKRVQLEEPTISPEEQALLDAENVQVRQTTRQV